MKKLFLIFLLSIGFIFSGSSTTVYASELPEENTSTEIQEEREEISIETMPELTEEQKEIEDYTTRLTEWIIAGVIGLLGTSALAIAFRKHLKNLIASVINGISLLKTSKDKADEDITTITKKAQDTIATLEKLKDEIVEQDKERFSVLETQIKVLITAFMSLVGGTKELVVNGTAEYISNILSTIDKEVNLNEGQKED